MIDEKQLIEEMEKTFPDKFLNEKNWFCGKCSFMDLFKELVEKFVPKVDEWIPCSDKLPENEEEVEISCIRRYVGAGNEKRVSCFTARAFYTDGTMTTEDSNFSWEYCDDWEYDEEKDACIIPEGWWECVAFSEEFGVVDAEVTAWRPIGEPYNPNTCKSPECPFYCPKQECVAKEECDGYTDEHLDPEWKKTS